MPTTPPRQCTRCRQPVAAGTRCPCRPPWTGKSTASARRNGSTRRSRAQRHAMLTEHPTCARTGSEWWWPGPPGPCRELATEDDHIVPLARGGDLDDPTNRQGLCTGCHDVKSAAEARHARTGHRP